LLQVPEADEVIGCLAYSRPSSLKSWNTEELEIVNSAGWGSATPSSAFSSEVPSLPDEARLSGVFPSGIRKAIRGHNTKAASNTTPAEWIVDTWINNNRVSRIASHQTSPWAQKAHPY
jgi:hypothetical protein